jgi:hypothetical protein
MHFYIAIIFFCASGECAFFKDSHNYYNKADCEKQVMAVTEVLTSRAVVNYGACFLIKSEQT